MRVLRRPNETIVRVPNRTVQIYALCTLQVVGCGVAPEWWFNVPGLLAIGIAFSSHFQIRVSAAPVMVVERAVLGVVYRRSRIARSATLTALPGGWGDDEPEIQLSDHTAFASLVVAEQDHDAFLDEVERARKRHRALMYR